MSGLVRDVRLAIRLLIKRPGFSLIAILTLALGIGGSTAVFSIIDAAVLRPLPYPEPDRLVAIMLDQRGFQDRVMRLVPSIEDVWDWQGHGRVFSHLAAWHNAVRPAVLDGTEPQRVDVRYMGDDFVALHGVTPLLGRAISREDLREGAEAVVVLGYGFWRSRFGGDREVVGRTIRLDNQPMTIVGVLPSTFYRESHLWRPLPALTASTKNRGTGATVFGRLRPGVTIDEAARTLTELTRQIDRERARPETLAVHVRSLVDDTAAGSRRTANILGAAVASILLIACLNVAGLLLATGAARRPELAVRASIGASRGRLVRQLLTESLVLSTAGGLLGLLLASLALDALVANIPMSLPPNSQPALNVEVLAFAIALTLATGVAFGLAPALGLSRVNLTGALAHAGRRHGSALSRRSGQLLVAVEIALALVLLAGAGLMVRSFANVLNVDLGFDPASIVAMEVVPVDPSEATVQQYYPPLVEALRGLPAIDAAGAVDYLPLAGGSTVTAAFGEGEPFVPGPQKTLGVRQFVPGYFEAMQFELKEGRLPAAVDRSARVAVLNESAAKQIFREGSALGRRFRISFAEPPEWFTVVGVVADVRHWGPLSPAEPEAYIPFGGRDATPMVVVVRPGANAPALGDQLRKAARSIGPRVVVHSIRRGADLFSERIVTQRQRTMLLGLLGTLGVLLALVGVFGMTAYAVARRTQEIGVRVALGARPADVVGLMLRESVLPVAIGISIGLGGAALSTRVISSFLFETTPTDPFTFSVVAAALAAAACLAAWIPARRAALVDPIAALRAE